MSRARNNIAECMDPKLRRLACRLLYDYGGKHYAEVRTQMAAAGFTGKLHASTLMAWMKSAEYLRYAAAREREDNEDIRVTAQAINDGNGPRDYADVAVLEVVKSLAARMRTGEISELGDLAQVTKALAPLLRAQIASDAESARRRESELKTQLAAQDIAHEDEIVRLREDADRAAAEIARLVGILETHGLKADGGTGHGLSSGTIANIKRLYGI